MKWFRCGICQSGLLVLFTLVVSVSIVTAQDKDNFYTVEKSVLEAMANNWGIKTKKEKIDEASYVKEQAKADFFPKFSTTYSYTRLDEAGQSNSVPLGLGLTIPSRLTSTEDNYQWKSSVKQPLFTGFALLSAYELAKLGIDRSDMEFELEKLDLSLSVKEAYFNILKSDKAVDVVNKSVESLESHVKTASSFYDVGIIPVNDLLKAEVELANAQQNLVKAQHASRLARHAFNTTLARSVDLPVEVEDILTYTPEAVDLGESLNKALKRRPDMKVLDISVLQADQQIRLAKSKYYPEAALTYDYIKEGDHFDVSGDEFHDAHRWQAMAILSWTFWEWGKTANAVKEKGSLKKQLMLTRSSLIDSISLEIRKAALELELTEKNIPTTKKAVEQAEENLRVSEERYRAQVTTSTEVLDAQTQLTQARINYYSALYDHHLAKARLQRAVGEN